MLEAGVTQPIDSHPVHHCLRLFVGQPDVTPAIRLVQRRPLLKNQPIGRDVLRTCTDGPVEGLRPVIRALTGQAEHQVQIDVVEPGLTRQPDSLFSLVGRMGATDPLEESILNRLNPQAQPGHAALSQRAKLRKIHRPRVRFECDLYAVLKGEGGPTLIEEADELRRVEYWGGRATKE